jgi:hypothetical protein
MSLDKNCSSGTELFNFCELFNGYFFDYLYFCF